MPDPKSGNLSDLQCPPVPQPDPDDVPVAAQRKSSGNAELWESWNELAKAQIR